jgi:nucleoid DNA-binding protein
MIKAELVDAISAGTGHSKRVINEVIDSLAEITLKAVKEDDSVSIPGLGKFHLVLRNARTARNIRTGEIIEIPPKKVGTFSVAKALKEVLIEKN